MRDTTDTPGPALAKARAWLVPGAAVVAVLLVLALD